MALEANKRITYRSPQQFHVSQATIDIESLENDDNDGVSQLWIRKRPQNILLATLSRAVPQWRLDLAFNADEKIKLHAVGKSTIFLSGYLVPTESDDAVSYYSIDIVLFTK